MSFRNTRWFLGIAVGGAFSLAANSASAQITEDATLPNNSTVTINGNTFNIDGGTQAGRNLFHSFQQFSVPTNGTASFNNNDVNIQNIFSRVTGGSVSNIDGIIKALGTANLFLINPNGIIFGPNASLNVGGSFVGTTANAIQFGNQGFFSASEPNNPALLTVNPSALFFNQIAAASIKNNSVAPAGKDPEGVDARGLRVPDGKSLLLVGGNVNMDGGQLNAYGGRVELGGLAASGNVVLNVDGNKLSLDFPASSTRADIFLTNGAAVFVEAGGRGDIAVYARNLEVREGSVLSAGIGQDLGNAGAKAGDIALNATGDIKIDGSGILNNVQQQATGNGGNIDINAASFSLTNGAQLQASTFGQGNAGNVTVNAKDAVSLAGNTYIFSTVEAGGVGKGGNIDIKAATLSLKDGAQLQTLTRGASATQPAGRGDAGDVKVNVTGAVDIAGRGTFPSKIVSQVETGTQGNGGNITIDSGSFSLRDGAQVDASTYRQGNAGNVTVNATDAVSLAGNAAIFSTVEAGGVGKGGNIDINAASLSLTNGAQLQASTVGQGNAGNVTVNAKDAVSLAGEQTAIFSRVEAGGVGNGGNIEINAASFSLTNGAGLTASTFGQGNAGNVTVNAKDAVSLAGNTYIFSTVEAGGVGKGGNIDIKAATLSLKDGAQLQTLTRGASDPLPAGRGDAGNVKVTVTGAVDIAGEKNGFPSVIASLVQTRTEGNGGNITINSGSFSLRDGAELTASTYGQGDAGTIKINAAANVTISGKSSNFNSGLYVNSQSPTGTAGDIIVTSPRVTLDNSGTLNAQSATGNGGNINLQSDLLLLRRGAQITTTAGTAQAGGNGGNITINTPNGFIVSVPNKNSDITANAFNGSGGVIQIKALSIYNFTQRSLSDLENLLGTKDPTKLDTQQLETNDITAISLTSPALSGQVNIITSFDPNRGLVELPAYVFDPSNQIAQGCAAFDQPNASDFQVTGRGGLPPSPDEPLSSDAVWEDTRLGATTPQRLDSKTTATKPKSESDTVEIIPATGWVFNGKGEVTLVSQTPNGTVENLAGSSQSCRIR
ncbi:filamentous hemagglutinin N-terminal domain-containing protein [Brasilonema sp. UFV-L1]|uniref:two-partner secretion domain-containing protein n=1 Tax=Brasilonema sp. UFV-L1 TaxID=2234130 RepID=UPI00145EB088|nr:filamentous hemagglutinin N-terminal domain-containing protein [Brasilonema sp. UFV-L1]NMG09240.1 filamentous hemagglutinin [Brasilonema sp. UFV-L1]